jgi:hypothetical protein
LPPAAARGAQPEKVKGGPTVPLGFVVTRPLLPWRQVVIVAGEQVGIDDAFTNTTAVVGVPV